MGVKVACMGVPSISVFSKMPQVMAALHFRTQRHISRTYQILDNLCVPARCPVLYALIRERNNSVVAPERRIVNC